MRDLAFLSMARTYYSASITPRRRTTRRRSTRTKLSRRGQVLEQGRRRQRVLARRAVRGVVGLLHGRRLPARARQHPHDRVAVLPELVLPGGGDPEGGHLLHELQVRRRRRRSSRASRRSTSRSRTSSRRSSSASRARTRRSRSSSSCKEVRDGKANLPPTHQARSSRTRSRDRQLLRNIEYVRVLDEEEQRFKKAPRGVPELAARQRRQGRAASSRAISRCATPASSLASATSATSTSSTSTSATARRSSSTSPPRSATSSTRRSSAGQVSKAGVEDLRRREARRGARPLAVRRRVLARRARLLSPGRRVGVREVR